MISLLFLFLMAPTETIVENFQPKIEKAAHKNKYYFLRIKYGIWIAATAVVVLLFFGIYYKYFSQKVCYYVDKDDKVWTIRYGNRHFPVYILQFYEGHDASIEDTLIENMLNCNKFQKQCDGYIFDEAKKQLVKASEYKGNGMIFNYKYSYKSILDIDIKDFKLQVEGKIECISSKIEADFKEQNPFFQKYYGKDITAEELIKQSPAIIELRRLEVLLKKELDRLEVLQKKRIKKT